MSERALQFDPEAFDDAFAKRPLAVSHGLTREPLLSLESVAELAERLPEDQIEHNVGAVSEVEAGGEVPRLDLPPAEIARGIEHNGCWMVLKRIETDARYRELLDDALAEATARVAGREGEVTRREGFIFLSSSNSTTPVHIDPEHNFLLQVRGSKSMTIASFASPETEQHELERYYAGGHRNLDQLPDEGTEYRLGPGDGVYVPVHAPHWVKTEGEVSVSLSVTFYTEHAERAGVVHAVNARLRRLRLSPSAPGRSSGVDRLKAGAWTGARRAVSAGRTRARAQRNGS